MGKLTSAVVGEVERLSRMIGELAADADRFLFMSFTLSMLSQEELREVADELAVDTFETTVDGVDFLCARIEFESPGQFQLLVNLTAYRDETRLVRWNDE